MGDYHIWVLTILIFIGEREENYLKKVIWILVSVVVLAAVGYYGYTYFSSTDSPSKNTTNTNHEETAPSVSKENVIKENEAKKIIPPLYEKFLRKVFDLGDQYQWTKGDNPPDMDVLIKGISEYTTENFAEAQIRPLADDLYCQCDVAIFANPHFDIRFKLIESTEDYIKIRSVEFENEAGSGGEQIFLTVRKQDGKWKIDKIKRIAASDKPLNVTWDEANKYLTKYYSKPQLIKKAKMNQSVYDFEADDYVTKKVSSYIYKLNNDDQVHGISTLDGAVLYEVPDEILPAAYKPKLLNESQARTKLFQYLELGELENMVVALDQELEDYFVFWVYRDEEDAPQVFTHGYYKVDKKSGDISEAYME